MTRKKGFVLRFHIGHYWGFIKGEDGDTYYFGKENIAEEMKLYYKDPMETLRKFQGEVEFTPTRPTSEKIKEGKLEWTATEIRWNPPQLRAVCPVCGRHLNEKWNYCPNCGTRQAEGKT